MSFGTGRHVTRDLYSRKPSKSINGASRVSAGSRQSHFQDSLVALIPRLKRYAHGLTGSAHDRDDLVQSTLERAMQKRHQWRETNKLDGWVFSILNSVWKNELRSRSVRRGNGFVDIERLSETTNHSQLESAVLLDQVHAAVLQLPEAQRAAIMLVDIEGFAYRDAAATLDIPIGTLMSRLARGRQRLLESLAPTLNPANHTSRKSDAASEATHAC